MSGRIQRYRRAGRYQVVNPYFTALTRGFTAAWRNRRRIIYAGRQARRYANAANRRGRSRARTVQGRRLRGARGYRRSKASTTARLKKLNKCVQESFSHHTRRTNFGGQILTAAQTSQLEQVGFGVSALQANMSFIRYYDAATNSLVRNNPSDNSWNQTIKIVGQWGHFQAVNNWTIPVKVTIYRLTPKTSMSGSDNPITVFTNGMRDQTWVDPVTFLDEYDVTNTNAYPTDCDDLKNLFTIRDSKTKVLPAGGKLRVSYYDKTCWTFDPSQYDETSSNDQVPKWRTFYWLCRTEGVVGHSVSQINDGGAKVQCGVDYYGEQCYKFEYNSGGTALNDFTISESTTHTGTTSYAGVKTVPENVSRLGL